MFSYVSMHFCESVRFFDICAKTILDNCSHISFRRIFELKIWLRWQYLYIASNFQISSVYKNLSWNS